MDNLIILKNNEPLTTSLIVAKELNRKHFSIVKLINENKISFEKFGVLQLEVEKPNKKTKGGRPEKFYIINEQHLTFLIMMLRVKRNDEDIVLSFKERITKEFFRMRKALLQAELNRKNEEWIQTRQKGKESRKEFTDAIKKLQIEHAKKHPDSNYTKRPSLLYSNYTRMINKALFDIQISAKNKREYMTKEQLSFLDVAEIKMQKIIEKCIDENKDAKETYKILETEIKPYAEWIGKTTIIDLITNNQVDINNLLENKND